MHRRRIALMLLLGLAAGALSACHEDQPRKPKVVAVTDPAQLKRAAESAQQQLAGLKPLLESLNRKIAELRRQFDPLPPGLPGFGETRGRFYATAEGVGRMNAKVPWLSGRIDVALESGDSAELADVAKDIAHAYDEVRQVEKIAADLGRDVEPFEHVVEDALVTGNSSCE